MENILSQKGHLRNETYFYIDFPILYVEVSKSGHVKPKQTGLNGWKVLLKKQQEGEGGKHIFSNHNPWFARIAESTNSWGDNVSKDLKNAFARCSCANPYRFLPPDIGWPDLRFFTLWPRHITRQHFFLQLSHFLRRNKRTASTSVYTWNSVSKVQSILKYFWKLKR